MQASNPLHYFTGKPCRNGHIADRRISNGRCVECVRDAARTYRANQREKIRGWQREYASGYREKKRHFIQKYDAAHKRAERAKNPERVRSRARAYYARNRSKFKAQRLRYVYGITQEQYDEMLRRQNGKCAICEKEYAVLAVDHCHDTGGVRGLLCTRCNMGIGFLQHNLEHLLGAFRYLHAADPRTTQVLVEQSA